MNAYSHILINDLLSIQRAQPSMHTSYLCGAIVASLFPNIVALTYNTKAPFHRRDVDPNLGGRVSPLNRPNVNYTHHQLNALKLAYTQVERVSLLQSYGNTDDYFKFDFTSVGAESNAGRGEGGFGFLAYVPNFPILLGTGVSMAIGYLQPCG